MKNQIGLLRDYYERRLASASASGAAPVLLQDDPPNPSQTKLGPLGQVMRPSGGAFSGAASGSKKKAKPKDHTTAAAVNGSTAAAPLARAADAGVASGSMGLVVQTATPVLSPQMPSASVPLSASSVVLSTTGMATPTMTPAPEQHTPKKKGAPGPSPGVGAAAANGGGPGAGSGSGKKRGRPPEGLPPIVVASA